jgi:mono/diheme cytochrome c family protein
MTLLAVLLEARTGVATLAVALFASPGAVFAQTASTPLKSEIFTPIARVLMHPRCMNCHQAEAPRQTDARLLHSQGISRGVDGLGAVGQRCATCHQAANAAQGTVPGAVNWHLAPASMSWQGLSAGEICRQIKDPARNGNRRTAEQVIDHMSSDPLVLWAWQPGGGRSLPPMSHDDFVKALRAWADQGLPCP